jgi:proline iminopeptidase
VSLEGEMRVPVKGAELHCSARGEGPACLVPSAIGTKPYERLVAPPVSDRLRLVFVDLRGGGESTGEPTDLTFDVLADDLDAVRARLGIERIAVLGHSILGMVAIEYGRRRPDRVSHVSRWARRRPATSPERPPWARPSSRRTRPTSGNAGCARTSRR